MGLRGRRTKMKIKEIMTQSAVCCGPETNVGIAVELMWERNIGMLPVVASDQTLVGVVTDRDICIAMGTRNRPAGELRLGEIAVAPVFTCKPDDDIHEALNIMAKQQVRRLVIVDQKGIPQGILSMDDVIVHADIDKLQGFCELSSEEVIRTLKRVYGQKFPVVQRKAIVAAA